jgi:hypothetical protein
MAAPAACGGDDNDVLVPEASMTITLRSPAFADEGSHSPHLHLRR